MNTEDIDHPFVPKFSHLSQYLDGSW